jgi:hypothetical protein
VASSSIAYVVSLAKAVCDFPMDGIVTPSTVFPTSCATSAGISAICERYEDPTRVLNYLGRYLHGGPIGQSRLLAFDGTTVTFRYKDYRDVGANGPCEKATSLTTDEFIRRLLQHVPPKGFHMVRGFGLYRRGGSTEALRKRVRAALPIRPEIHAALTSPFPATPGVNDIPGNCPHCGSPVYLVVYMPRGKNVRCIVYPPRGSPAMVAA